MTREQFKASLVKPCSIQFTGDEAVRYGDFMEALDIVQDAGCRYRTLTVGLQAP